MFCDGQCEKKGKRCGMLVDETLENSVTGEVRTEKKCFFYAAFGSMQRIEKGMIRLQEAVEKRGDTQAEASLRSGDDIAKTMAQVGIAISYALQGTPVDVQKKIDNLKSIAAGAGPSALPGKNNKPAAEIGP